MAGLLRIKILFLLCLLFSWNVGAKEAEATRILLFGDSLVAGYGVQRHEALPVQVQSILESKGHGVEVINGGVSGDTTSGGRSRLDWTLKKHKPDLVVLALGGNDLLRGIPPKVTHENIHAMLHTLKAKQIPTILSAVEAPKSAGAQFQTQFNAIYEDTAKHYNVPLFPFFLRYTFGNPQLMQADGIHPNAAGARTIATHLAEYLAKALQSV